MLGARRAVLAGFPPPTAAKPAALGLVAACAQRARASHPIRAPLSSGACVFNHPERLGLFENVE